VGRTQTRRGRRQAMVPMNPQVTDLLEKSKSSKPAVEEYFTTPVVLPLTVTGSLVLLAEYASRPCCALRCSTRVFARPTTQDRGCDNILVDANRNRKEI
jgi:hypothetical protein